MCDDFLPLQHHSWLPEVLRCSVTPKLTLPTLFQQSRKLIGGKTLATKSPGNTQTYFIRLKFSGQLSPKGHGLQH